MIYFIMKTYSQKHIWTIIWEAAQRNNSPNRNSVSKQREKRKDLFCTTSVLREQLCDINAKDGDWWKEEVQCKQDGIPVQTVSKSDTASDLGKTEVMRNCVQLTIIKAKGDKEEKLWTERVDRPNMGKNYNLWMRVIKCKMRQRH